MLAETDCSDHNSAILGQYVSRLCLIVYPCGELLAAKATSFQVNIGEIYRICSNTVLSCLELIYCLEEGGH